MNGPTSSPTYADDARRYLLESRIATGGMGEVWRATDTVLGREVAVKLLKHEYADDALFRSRFETEARHAAALSHPGIAGVYDFGEATAADGSGSPRPYLVMELVDGQPLSALLAAGRPLDPAAVRELLAQVGDALGAAHAAGIVHRDVKPANLLVTPQRQVKVTDFGIARAAEGIGLTQTGQVMGTPQYLSPEQARGNPATPASDVYSLGVVAFECLAGHRPFQAESPVATALAHLHDPVPDLPASVPADLAAVVRRAMSKEAGQRYADGSAFAAALRDPATAVVATPAPSTPATAYVPPVPPAEHTQLLTGVGAPPVDPTPTPADGTDQSEPRRRGWWPVLLVALLLLAIGVGAYAVTRSGDDEEPTDEPSATVTAETVRIDAERYLDRPVDEVVEELKDLDLRVSTEEVANPGDEIPGLVSALNPTGRLEVGDPITVSYWGEVPEEEPTETPSEEPTEEPTDEPTETPSEEPTEEPTDEPTPTEEPTEPAPTTPTSSAAVSEPGADAVTPSGDGAAASSLASGSRSDRKALRR